MSEAQRQAALARNEKGTQARGWKRPIRTHCKNGHALVEENIYLRRDGERACRICRTAETEAWWEKQSPEKQEARRQRNIKRATKWNREHPEEFKENCQKQEERPEVIRRRKEFYEETKSALWRKYSHLKSSAKQRKIEFALTQEEYEQIVSAGVCVYSGDPLPEVGYGVDRQDNRLGYTKENSVACCERCNERKGSLEGLGFQYPRTIQLMMELLGNN